MNQSEDNNQNSFKSAVTITVIGVAVITFVVIFLALFAGLWLDRLMHSRPIFTISLVIISIPVTIILMVLGVVSRSFVRSFVPSMSGDRKSVV
jgi:ABC-type transport system involved in cytochrome c biogenesis permease subunit